MPIPVACQCGQRFAANDQLAGRQVACPACGRSLQIPSEGASPPPAGGRPAASSAASSAGSQGGSVGRQQQGAQAVRCARCGGQFAAGAHLVGQILPCPRCGSPISLGQPPSAKMEDDLFDELPSIEEQQASLSEEARREQLRKRRREQRVREAERRKRALAVTGQVATMLGGLLMLGFAGLMGYRLTLLLKDVTSVLSGLPLSLKITMIANISVLGLAIPLALLSAAMLLTKNGTGRLLAIFASALVALVTIALTVVLSIEERPLGDPTAVVVDLLACAVPVGVLFFPGVSKHLGLR